MGRRRSPDISFHYKETSGAGLRTDKNELDILRRAYANHVMAAMPQITNPGALWDESLNFYPRLGGTPQVRLREWRWRHGGKIKFSHLQFETTVYDW